MNEYIRIIMNWLIPLILSGVITLMIKMFKDNLAIKRSMLALIRSQITGKCETYMDKGCLPEYARYCLDELFKQYKTLGGNHGIEKLVEQCFTLPPK